MQHGLAGLRSYLERADAMPLRDYVPALPGSMAERLAAGSCRGRIVRAESDDDINYTVLALTLLEAHGAAMTTADVARAWLRLLPAGTTWTAERHAYRILLREMDDEFVNGADPGFDLARCSDNDCNAWIGAQIRADLYGWVCPGRPALAAELARRDAALSHRGEGVHGATFIAALGAAIPVTADLGGALDLALQHIPAESEAAAAVQFGCRLAGNRDAVRALHERYADLPPVHTLNNLAVVCWALTASDGDFATAVGDAVAAGWDTDCNGATVGGLLGLLSGTVPDQWTRPWAGKIGVNLAGIGELTLDDLVDRTVAVSQAMAINEEWSEQVMAGAR